VAVETVRLLGGREPGILPDRPRPVGVHRRARPAQIGRHAGQRLARWKTFGFDLFEIGFGVERLHRNAFRRLPIEARHRLAAQFRLGKLLPFVDIGPVLACHRWPPATRAPSYACCDYMEEAGARSNSRRRSEWRKTIAAVNSSTAPAWWAAASGSGTTSSSVT